MSRTDPRKKIVRLFLLYVYERGTNFLWKVCERVSQQKGKGLDLGAEPPCIKLTLTQCIRWLWSIFCVDCNKTYIALIFALLFISGQWLPISSFC